MKQRKKQILEANAELCVALQNPTLEKNDGFLPMFRCRRLIYMDDQFYFHLHLVEKKFSLKGDGLDR